MQAEILPVPYTPPELDKVERKALTLYTGIQRNTVVFAAYIRKLFEHDAHRLRGYPNFGEYIETRFEGLSAVNAMNLNRQGNVVLILEREGRIDLNDPESYPGTTGLRELSKAIKDFGEDTMLAIYDKAAQSGRRVTDKSVKAATALLIQPVVPELTAPALNEVDEDELEQEDHQPIKVQELIDRIRDLSYDLPESMGELEETTAQLRAELNDDSTEADSKWLSSSRDS